MRKPDFAYAKTMAHISFVVTAVSHIFQTFRARAYWCFLVSVVVNSYKPGIHSMGHMQTT